MQRQGLQPVALSRSLRQVHEVPADVLVELVGVKLSLMCCMQQVPATGLVGGIVVVVVVAVRQPLGA